MTSEGALEHLLGNVLGYPDDHQVRLALAYLGVHDINALTLFQDDDFTLPYNIPDPDDATKLVQTRLVHAYARRLNAVIKWFYSQPAIYSTYVVLVIVPVHGTSTCINRIPLKI
jgi:hypothetical protein